MGLVAVGVAEIREVPPLLYLHGLLIGILHWLTHLPHLQVEREVHQPHLEGEGEAVGSHRQYQCHRHSHNYLQQHRVGVGEEL
jgi:hypothetical protein